MKPELKKLISEHLNETLTREDLSKREASEMLGIKPQYISLILNEKYWDSCSAKIWEKVEAWHTSRLPLKEWQHIGPFTCQPLESEKNSENEPEKPPEIIQKEKEYKQKRVEASKLKVKQKRKTDPDKIQAEAFSKYSSTEAPFPVIPAVVAPDVQFTDTARLKVALDIEINLVVNGQKVQVR